MSNVVKVISKYLDLQESGSEYKACCPFHTENTPSFTVVPDGDYFWCFGCGAGGDAIDFVKRKEGVEFKEAQSIVCDILGLTEDQLKERKS
jgi:DNA primase